MNELNEKIWEGLELAQRRMIEEKALHGEEVVSSQEDGTIVRTPARQLLKQLYGVTVQELYGL